MSYISVHGPVVIFELAVVMLRRSFHLVDFQQQLVLLWLICTWKDTGKKKTPTTSWSIAEKQMETVAITSVL